MRGAGTSRKGAASTTRRQRWREAEARRVVQAWRTSGLSLSRFAADRGLSPARLSRWAKRLGTQRPVNRRVLERGSDVATSALKLRFHPVELVGRERHGDVIEVVLSHGRRVRVPAGFSAEDLGRVLEVLGRREQC